MADTHSIGFYHIPNSNESSGFGVVLSQREDERNRAFIAELQAKYPAPASTPVKRSAAPASRRAGTRISHAEAFRNLKTKGVPETRLRALFPEQFGGSAEMRNVEYRITRGPITVTHG